MQTLSLSEHRRPLRPLKAYKHFRNLIADKEDTTQVFYIVEALSGSSLVKTYNEFITSPEGQERYKEQRYLPTILDDHETLKALPAGTLGRAYVEFMEREGLTAQGLVDEHERFAETFDEQLTGDLKWYTDRRRDTHDMFHVLSGYGRDALGEASLLGFTNSQHRDPGILFIAYGAAWEVKKSAPKGAPVMRCIKEGRRLGKAADMIVKQDIISLLPLPLEEVRERLNIAPPKTYYEVHRQMRENGIDPYEVIGTTVVVA